MGPIGFCAGEFFFAPGADLFLGLWGVALGANALEALWADFVVVDLTIPQIPFAAFLALLLPGAGATVYACCPEGFVVRQIIELVHGELGVARRFE